MKITKLSKLAASVVALVFMFTQTIPTGLAEGSANASLTGDDSQQTAIKSLANVNAEQTPVEKQTPTTPKPTATPANTTDFQMNGLVLSASSVPAPTNVTATTLSTDGYVRLAGKKNTNTTVWYSLDGGTLYTQLKSALASSVSFSEKIALPTGSTTIRVISKTTEGDPSKPAVLAPITYTVKAPTDITVSAPTPLEGNVYLKSTIDYGTQLWYSLNNDTYKLLPSNGKITLAINPANKILVQARTTALIAGVSTVRSSETVTLDPIAFAIPKPAISSQSTVTSDGYVTLIGAKTSGTSVLFSLNGGITYTNLVDYTSSSSWTKTIALPVGSTTISLVSKTSAGLLSAPVTLDPISYAVSIPTGISKIAPVCEGANGAEKGYVAVKGTRAANTSIWYSLDGGTIYKELVKADPETSGAGWIPVPEGTTPKVLIQARTIAAVAGVSKTVRASEPVDLGAVTYAVPKIDAPTQANIKVSAVVTSDTAVVTLTGARKTNKNIAIWYSLDHGVTYKQLAASGNTATWTGTIRLKQPADYNMVLLKAVSPEGSSKQIIAFAPEVIAHLRELGELFLSPYTVTATPWMTEKDPSTWEQYKYDILLPKSDKTPGKLNTMTLYEPKFGHSMYVLSSITFNAQPPATSSIPVPPAMLLGGLSKLLPANQIDPRLVNVTGMDMNGLKLLPKVLVQSYKSSAGKYEIFLTVGGTHYRIFYDLNFKVQITKENGEIADPINITTTPSTPEGGCQVQGTKAANTSIWYTMDGGFTFNLFAAASANTSWTGDITLPKGFATVLFQSRKTVLVSGVTTTLTSNPVNIGIVAP